MQVEQLAQNLYKKHQGRYLIYELEGHEVSFQFKGEQVTTVIDAVKRDVFANKIIFTGRNRHTYDFREPSYITQENGDIIFNYVANYAKTFADESAEDFLSEVSSTAFKILK